MGERHGRDSWRDVRRDAREMKREAHRMRREERAERRAGGRNYDMPVGNQERRLVYRSRNGMIFGVCRGAAEYLGISVFWVRVLTVIATLFTQILPVVVAYIIAALVMKPEPVIPFEEESEQEFYDSYVNSRGMALARLKRTYDNIERRIRRMENLVTAHEYDWERRLNEP